MSPGEISCKQSVSLNENIPLDRSTLSAAVLHTEEARRGKVSHRASGKQIWADVDRRSHAMVDR